MSRVGKHPVEIIEGVSVELKDSSLIAKGKVGEVKVNLSPLIDVKVEDNKVVVSAKNTEDKNSRMMWGPIRALINNAIIGAGVGFT